MDESQFEIRFEETGRSQIALHRSFRKFAHKQLHRWVEGFSSSRFGASHPQFYVSFRRNRLTGHVDCRVNARLNERSFFGCGFGSGPQQALQEAITRLQVISRMRPFAATA
jgi:hypothetical protein